MDSINIKPVLDKIAKELAEQSLTWNTGGAAAGAAIGSVVPFFGTLTGALIGGAIGAMSGDKPTLNQAKAKERNRDERLKVYNVVNSEWENIKKNVLYTIDKEVNGNNNIREIVNKVTFDYLTAYKESLQSSRILID
jgi:phage tail tape-measure protein